MSLSISPEGQEWSLRRSLYLSLIDTKTIKLMRDSSEYCYSGAPRGFMGDGSKKKMGGGGPRLLGIRGDGGCFIVRIITRKDLSQLHLSLVL